jgi:hypothetical protein
VFGPAFMPRKGLKKELIGVTLTGDFWGFIRKAQQTS